VIGLTAAEVASSTGGRLGGHAGGARVTGPVEVDSRRVAPGGLFVAVRGEHVDGHEYAAAAVSAGAAVVIAERDLPGLPVVVVPDPVAALGRLAAAVLARVRPVRVVAVTGSAGKTTTKDLAAGLLADIGRTVAAPGSYNTEIGLPLTVLRVEESTSFLVLEMGARGVGHIRDLARIARPDLAVVLGVGSAHIGEFGSRATVAQAKGEIVEALTPDGMAVLNADDPLVEEMAGRTSASIRWFGTATAADIRAADVTVRRGRASFTLHAGGAHAPVSLRLVGAHQVTNALAAATVALACGMRLDQVAGRLSDAEPASPWRMALSERADGVTVLNDAYNANPESTRAALLALGSVADGRRTWAVLGEMRELGTQAEDEHRAAGRLAAELGVTHLVVVGQAARAAYEGAGEVAGWRGTRAFVADVAGALAQLRERLSPGDVVLVKASRAAGLERVAAALLEEVVA
jgi:UDP-N-acetylmuramoyl-tripeptide--D-alanyl-D-alanine ligase